MKASQNTAFSVALAAARADHVAATNSAYMSIEVANHLEAMHRNIGSSAELRAYAQNAVVEAVEELREVAKTAKETRVHGWGLLQLMEANAKRKFDARICELWPNGTGR